MILVVSIIVIELIVVMIGVVAIVTCATILGLNCVVGILVATISAVAVIVQLGK